MLNLFRILCLPAAFATNARINVYADLARETFNFSDTFRLVRAVMLGSEKSGLSWRFFQNDIELDDRRYFIIAESPTARLQFSEPITGVADHQTPSNVLEALLFARLFPTNDGEPAHFNVTTQVLKKILEIKADAIMHHLESQYKGAWSESLRGRLMRAYVANGDIAFFRLWLEAESARYPGREFGVIEPRNLGAIERDELLRLAQPGRTRNRTAVFHLLLARLALQLAHGLPVDAPTRENARAIGVYARALLNFRELSQAALKTDGFAFNELARAVVPKAVRFAQIAPTFDEPLPLGARAESDAHMFSREAIWFHEAIVTSAYYQDLISADSAAPVCAFYLD